VRGPRIGRRGRGMVGLGLLVARGSREQERRSRRRDATSDLIPFPTNESSHRSRDGRRLRGHGAPGQARPSDARSTAAGLPHR